MQLPGLLILINDSITTAVQNTLHTSDSPNLSVAQHIDTQLQINETINFDEFNARVAADPNYPAVVHLNNLRVLVISSNLHDQTNRALFDIVMFVKGGLASVLKCKSGKPGFTLDIQRINIFNLIYGISHSGNEVCCPFPIDTCPPHFPPRICPPQLQTPENPRPPERTRHRHPEGLGTLELFGTEALEENGMDEGVFGDQIQPEHRGLRLPIDEDKCGCDDDKR